MSTQKLTLTPASITRTIRPFVSDRRDGPPPLDRMTQILLHVPSEPEPDRVGTCRARTIPDRKERAG